MASSEEVYREAQVRLHRVLGAFLTMKSWKNGIDCVILERDTLLSFLDIERMRNTRIDWLKEDLKYLFKYAHTTNTSSTGTYAELYLSRLKIPSKNGVWSTMTSKQRVEKLLEVGIKAQIIELPSEKKLLTRMALISNGLEKI